MGRVVVSGRGSALTAAIARPAVRGAVGGPTRVVDGVNSRRLVPARIRFHPIPAEQPEGFVEVGTAVEVRRQSVGVVSIAVANPRIDERNSDLAGFPDAILVVVNVGAGVEIRL